MRVHAADVGMQFESTTENGNKNRKSDRRFKRAVGRVLIALSFKTGSRSASQATTTTSGDDAVAYLVPNHRPRTSEHRPASFSGGFGAGSFAFDGEMEENGDEGGIGLGGGGDYMWRTINELSNTRWSSGLARTSARRVSAEDSDQEPTPPPRLRRERRKAICESKVLGLSNTQDDDSCDGSETSAGTDNVEHRQRSLEDLSGEGKGGRGVGEAGGNEIVSETRPRRRAVPPPLIKRNTIADFANTKAYQVSMASFISNCDQDKRTKSTFSLLKLIDKKGHHSRDNLCQLSDVLQALKPSEFNDSQLAQYKEANWAKILPNAEPEMTSVISETERKRREAVWELFTSECVFLFDHLMALKHCFMEPLKKVQVEGHLMFAEPQDLFGNLDELCYVSYTFCYDYIRLLLKDADAKRFGNSEILVQALKRLCELTRDGEVYHDYCLNYPKAISYLEQLRKNDDFCEFEKWCEQDSRCRRLQLTDLLISPLQHWTKVPLLMNSIRRYTLDSDEQLMLTESVGKLETSLKLLEAKMKSLKNYERLQEIQQQVIWQPITELEPRAFIPEFLKPALSRQPCARILSSPGRQLLHEGPVTLVEVSKTVDMYLFLFDDILLLTKVKKPPRKKSSIIESSQFACSPKTQTDGAIFVVHRQPLALDRFAIHDIKASEASVNGLKNALVLLQISRFQQVLGVFTLQTYTEISKATWLTQLQSAQDRFRERLKRLDSDSSSRGSSNDNLTTFDDNTSSSFFPYSSSASSHTTNLFKNHLNLPSTRSSSLYPASSSSSSSPRALRNYSCPDTTLPCPPFTIPRIVNGQEGSGAAPASQDPDHPTAVQPSDQSVRSNEGPLVVSNCGYVSTSRQYLGLPSPIKDCEDDEGQVSKTKVIPRSRPSSLHSKRRSMLKAIREKSLSIDLTTVPN